MSVQDYLSKMKNIQEKLLAFLDSDDKLESTFQEFTDFLQNQNIQDQYLIEFLNLISEISKNHYRKHNLISKIEKILFFLKDDIIQHLTSTRLFDIFINSKRILLYLLEEQFITINEHIYLKLKKNVDYVNYFAPELSSYLTKQPKKVDPLFEESRREGENQDYVCKLIRTDSVNEFTTYVNESKISLSKFTIKQSFFETNSFLESSDTSLIDYAAFFGSIEIFKFLQKNDVELSEMIYLYAIHSNNAELIHIIEESNIDEKLKKYERYYSESISCFHNNIAKYFEIKCLSKLNNSKPNLNIFHNFDFFPIGVLDKSLFYDLCKCDYFMLASIMINDLDGNDLNIILNQLFFF